MDDVITGSTGGFEMRVLHAPVTVGNQAWTLSRAERELGNKSDVVVNYNTWIQYRADRVLSTYQTKDWREIFHRWFFGLSAPFRYQVLHYYFGRSSLVFDDLPHHNVSPFLDLKIARFLGRKIFMTLQGCDARLAAQSNRRNDYTPCAEGKCSAYANCVSTVDAQRQTMIDSVLPLCDRVFYLNPELGHYVPDATFMPYTIVDIDAIDVEAPSRRERPRIIHAPSDPNIKGTPLILEALDRLKSRFDFDLVLVDGKPHHEAMEIYKSADLVIDQVFAGWYGGFAVEVMAMGKPVAAAIRQADLKFIPSEMREQIPVLSVDPSSLTEDLAKILERRNEWDQIGLAGRQYVERWHHPRRIAKAMNRIYKDPSAPFEILEAS